MSGRGGREDKRIERTVGYLLPCPRSSVLEAMQAFKFSDEESEDAGKQMVVRRRRPAWREMRGGVNARSNNQLMTARRGGGGGGNGRGGGEGR